MIALAELKKLPLAERLQLVEDLWDSIDEEQEALPDPPELIEELRARHAAYLTDPSSAIPWELALEKIRSGRE
jgi:putative addiction module component (TIGR02574 family)